MTRAKRSPAEQRAREAVVRTAMIVYGKRVRCGYVENNFCGSALLAFRACERLAKLMKGK